MMTTLHSLQQFESMAVENQTVLNTVSEHLPSPGQNTSSPDGCITVVFSKMEFLPWDNPQNIISEKAERIVNQLKLNLLVLLFLIGGPANVLNMAVFYKQGLKDRVNLCLFALSLTDELFLVNAFIHHGEQIYMQFFSQERFGPVMTFLGNNNLVSLVGFYYVSFVLSAIIATERCLCIYNPLKFRSLLSTKTMTAVIVGVYVVVLGLYFIAAFRYRVGCLYDPETDTAVTGPVEGGVYRANKEFFGVLESYTFGVGLPGVVLIIVITTTVMTIVKLRQVVKWRSETTSSSISAQELAVTKTLVASSLFFIVCLLPGSVNRFSWLFIPEMSLGRRHHNLVLTAFWIGDTFNYINSTFNFFVYYIMGSRFRQTFWALFGPNRAANKTTSGSAKDLVN